MLLYFILLGSIGVLFLVSGRVKLPEHREFTGWKIPFYKSAYFLTGLGERLQNGQTMPQKKEAQMAERLADTLLVLFLGLGLTLLIEGVSGKTETLLEPSQVERPVNGEGSQTLPLQVKVEGMTEAADLEVTISERQYTSEEKNAFLEQALEELDTLVLGDNLSADKVQGSIVLPTELLDGKVNVQWTREVQPEDAVDDQGVISEDIPAEGVVLQLRGTLSCQDQEAIYQRALRLFPPDRDAVEQFLYELQKKVEEKDQETLEEERLILPSMMDGRAVIWQKREESVMGICLILTMAAAATVYFGKEQELQKQEQRRRRQLIMDFPGLLFQLSMLLEAGLTMQNAFCKIALDYRERKAHECRFVYEEMLVSCYEMQSGVSERKAYEDFGRRCGENCYVRLGTTLSGSLQKGAQGLTGMLKEEALTAMETRRQLAKKLGEEAGTRLLMPMMLMLVVVLIILMVPAVMSF